VTRELIDKDQYISRKF